MKYLILIAVFLLLQPVLAAAEAGEESILFKISADPPLPVENLVKDGGFEAVRKGWNPLARNISPHWHPSVRVTCDQGQAFRGRCFLRIESSGEAKSGGAHHSVKLRKGVEYLVRGYMKTRLTQGTGALYLDSPFFQWIGQAQGDTPWTEYSLRFTPKSDCETYIHCYKANFEGAICYDEIFLTPRHTELTLSLGGRAVEVVRLYECFPGDGITGKFDISKVSIPEKALPETRLWSNSLERLLENENTGELNVARILTPETVLFEDKLLSWGRDYEYKEGQIAFFAPPPKNARVRMLLLEEYPASDSFSITLGGLLTEHKYLAEVTTQEGKTLRKYYPEETIENEITEQPIEKIEYCLDDDHKIVRGIFVEYGVTMPDLLTDTLCDLNANALMVNPRADASVPYSEGSRLGKLAGEAHNKGLHVHLYMLPRPPTLEVKGLPWYHDVFTYSLIDLREPWAEILKNLSRYPLDGITVVPDEWYWSPDERFPAMVKRFQERYAKKPDDDQRLWNDFISSYSAETAGYWSDCVKKVNARIKTTALLSISPVLRGEGRAGSGVTWDLVGYEADLDSLTSDPYIVRHYSYGRQYVADTVKHLMAAHKRRRAEVVLQATNLKKGNRELRPVEVYGSALSALGHGAKGVWAFHLDGLLGRYDWLKDTRDSYDLWKDTFKSIKAISPWIKEARVPRNIAVLYSRNSEDYYDGKGGSRYPYLAQRETLHFLESNGYPFELYYLEQVEYKDLKDFKLLILPFAYEVDNHRMAMLKKAVEQGISLLVLFTAGKESSEGKPCLADVLGIDGFSETVSGSLDFPDTSPVLPGERFTFGQDQGYRTIRTRSGTTVLTQVEGKPAGLSVRQWGKSKSVFFQGTNCLYGLKDRAEVMRAILDWLLEESSSLFVEKNPGADVEVSLLENSEQEKTVFLINWGDAESKLTLRLPFPNGTYALEEYCYPPPRLRRYAQHFGQARLQGNRVGQVEECQSQAMSSEQLGNLSLQIPPYAVRVIHIRSKVRGNSSLHPVDRNFKNHTIPFPESSIFHPSGQFALDQIHDIW